MSTKKNGRRKKKQTVQKNKGLSKGTPQVRGDNRTRNNNRSTRRYEVEESARGGLSIRKIRDKVRRQHRAHDVHPDCDVPKAALLSIPTTKYLSTLANPTLDETQMAPLPIANQVPGGVQLGRHTVRGSFTCSPSTTFGFSFASICPGACLGYVDRTLVLTTNSNFLGSVFDTSQGGTQYGRYFPASAYSTTAQGPDDYAARVVGCRIDIRNTTPEMGRGGTLYFLEPHAHDADGIWGQSIPAIANNPRVSQFNLGSSDTFSMIWHPSTDAAQGVDDASYPLDSAKQGLDFCSFTNINNDWSNESYHGEMVCMVQNPASLLDPGRYQPQTLEFEVNVVYERTGRNVHGTMEYPRDAEGWGYAVSAINEMKAKSGEVDPPSKSVTSQVREYLTEAIDAAEEVLPVAQNLFSLLG